VKPCTEIGHQWEAWLPYDEHVVEAGVTDGLRYHRSCRVLGCSAEQRAEDLAPIGRQDERNFTDQPPAVHILVRGWPLCKFAYPKVPGEWPAGHRWISLPERNGVPAKDRCEDCYRRASKFVWPEEADD